MSVCVHVQGYKTHGIVELEHHADEHYDIASHTSSHGNVNEFTDQQLMDAESHAETDAREEARKAGGDKEDQDEAAHEAERAVRFAAATEGTKIVAKSPSPTLVLRWVSYFALRVDSCCVVVGGSEAALCPPFGFRGGLKGAMCAG